jgi:NTE family protein
VFPLNPVTGLLGFLGARNHLVPDSGLRHIVRTQMSFERVEGAAVPLHVIATDVLCGEEVRLSEGPLLDAVMASAAIPGVLPAVEWNGRELIDGGVANNAPLSHALELGAEEIYVLPTGTPCELDEAPRGALAMFIHATGLLVGRRFAQEVAAIPHDVDVAVLPPPCPLAVQPTDFSQAGMLMEQGLADARRYLDRRERRRVVRIAHRSARQLRSPSHGELPPAA